MFLLISPVIAGKPFGRGQIKAPLSTCKLSRASCRRTRRSLTASSRASTPFVLSAPDSSRVKTCASAAGDTHPRLPSWEEAPRTTSGGERSSTKDLRAAALANLQLLIPA